MVEEGEEVRSERQGREPRGVYEGEIGGRGKERDVGSMPERKEHESGVEGVGRTKTSGEGGDSK